MKFIIIAQALLIGLLVFTSCDEEAGQHNEPAPEDTTVEDHAIYEAWNKVYDKNLTFEQWKSLRDNDMLPHWGR